MSLERKMEKMLENGNITNQTEQKLTSIDGREIAIRDLEQLVMDGQSWSSLQFGKLSKLLGMKFSLPDCNDPRFIGSFPVLEWVKMKPTAYEPSIIYCTWASAGGKDSTEFTKRQLDAFTKLQIKPDIFIIDAGWFKQAGDWDVDRKKFPDGIEEAVNMVHEFGTEAWVWIGPFIVSRQSQLAKKHPSWLVQTAKEEPKVFWYPTTANATPHFILNYSNIEAQEYLAEVFNVIKSWGVDGVKADYLSNAFFIPIDQCGEIDSAYAKFLQGNYRLKMLTLVHDFLIKIKGLDMGVLACGCPFTAALGAADFVRVSNDSGLPAKTVNPELAKRINHILISGVDRGVRKVTPLIKKFGINPDPDMFYQFDISPQDLERLRQIQVFSIKNGGCLTLGDDFSQLSSGQIDNVRQLVSLFKSTKTNPKPP